MSVIYLSELIPVIEKKVDILIDNAFGHKAVVKKVIKLGSMHKKILEVVNNVWWKRN